MQNNDSHYTPYFLKFNFSSDAGILKYLNGKEFILNNSIMLLQSKNCNKKQDF